MPAKFVKSIGRTLDARPDRLDLRDREFTPSVVCLPEQWPSDADIRKLVPLYCKSGLVLDQGPDGACTGFGLACVINYLHWRASRTTAAKGAAKSAKSKVRPVSPRMLYHLARFYDEWAGEDYDGSSCRGALKAWHKHGVCSEELWPYRDERGKVRFMKPADDWAQDALSRRLGVYYRINRASVVDLQAAILEIGAIYVSCDVHDGWAVTSKRKITGHDALPVIKEMKNESSLGGHAFALVGFNRTGFIVQNSWGESWGNCGFAVLPYEQWVQYGTDAWIAALGVPSAAKTMRVRVGNREKTVIARAGAITFTSSARRAKPAVSKVCAPLSAEEAYRHTLVIGNDGEVLNRIVTHENAMSCVEELACDAVIKALGKTSTKHLTIYAHGGLNSEDASIDRIQTLAPYFRANGVHPLFLTWKTGPAETLSAILDDELKRIPRPEGDAGALFERVKETAAEVLDRTIEVMARPAAKPIWSQMKQNASAAIEPDRGGALLVGALKRLRERMPDVRIHLIGHSAGSIILGHLLDLMPSHELKVDSCHLYAPACTVRFALDHYLPAIRNETLPRDRLHIHVLSDSNEICDTVGPYRKSLLYLVSRALESCHKMPILGLEQIFDSKNNPKWHTPEQTAVKEWQSFWKGTGNGVDILTEKQVSTGLLGRKIQASHGCFDNDATTIETTLTRILGTKPGQAIEWIDY